MATKTIVSGENKTPVGKSGTELFTKTRTTYTLDENGKIDPNSVKQEILYSQVPGDPPVIAATRNGTTGDFTLNKNEFTGKFYFGADAQKSLKEGALKTTTNQQIEISAKKEGLTPEQQKTIAASTANNAPDPGTSGAVDGRNFDDDIKGSNKTRDKFPILVYPTKLAESKQDIIRFNMLKYDPKKFSTERGNLGGFGERQVRNSIGTVTLPIPNGISDTNAVTWGGETMNAVEAMLGNIALTSIKSGFAAGAGEVQKTGENLQSGSKEVQSGLAAAFTSLALGQSGGQFLSRTAGAVLNPNLELLFSAPTLRPFNFTFKLASRSEDESKTIRSIIRFFKQGMSPQRSKSNLFLKAPHTFQIQYLHRNEEHKFLNKFKECALQSFNVSYTPEGQYATFTDGAMVSYQITMQFQELEPIFNDDYTNDGTNPSPDIGY